MRPRSEPSILMVATVSGTIRHFLSPISDHMRRSGWHVDAAAAGASDDDVLASHVDRVFDLPLSRSIRDIRGLVAGGRAIARLLAETEPDIVHVHTPIASFLTRLAVRSAPSSRRPMVVYTAHGFHFNKNGHPVTNAAFSIAERIAGRWTDRLIVINDEDEEAARRIHIVPRSRLIRHPGIGLDTTRYARAAVDPTDVASVRSGLGIAASSPVFVVVGELNGNKRQGDVIAALARQTDDTSHLILVGDGPLRSVLEATAIDLGVAGRVHLVGLLDDVRPVLASATVLVAPSQREGLSRSVMEALSLGVPVVASNARGNAELVGDSGFVCAYGDVTALANAMGWLISHPRERQAMGERARARIVDTYDVSRVVGLHAQLYTALLADATIPS